MGQKIDHCYIPWERAVLGVIDPEEIDGTP